MARFVITVPVADLRSEPEIVFPNDFSHQDGRESQLLFGETVQLIEEQGEWLKVGALEQLRYTPQEGWHPYPGWIHRSEITTLKEIPLTYVVCTPGHLSYGTLVNPLCTPTEGMRPLPTHPSREQIVAEAWQFLDAPYLWGGRSSILTNQIASVDCSGLISLLYRAQGIQIPRNTHDQYLTSRPAPHLQPGDPLYLAKEQRINHVVLKLEDKIFIEAPETGKTVRLLTWGIHIWEKEGKIHFLDHPHSYTPYPRTFIA